MPSSAHCEPMRLEIAKEDWPLARTFRISRGAIDMAEVVVVTLTRGGHKGRGECLPYDRYGETVVSVMAQIESLAPDLEAGLTREALHDALPPGAARNALDCALWDLACKEQGTTIRALSGVTDLPPAVTVFTVPYDSAEAMAAVAAENAHRPALKVKLASADDLARLKAVRAAAPEARLTVDANEAWTLEAFNAIAPDLEALGVTVVEQPLPAGRDEGLDPTHYRFDLCADEACHTRADLPRLKGHYSMVNIKLDKTGGLTEGLALRQAALAQGFKVMIGCMVATSLSMAPAMLLTPGASLVDLDGPILLRADRVPGLRFEGSTIHPPTADLWG